MLRGSGAHPSAFLLKRESTRPCVLEQLFFVSLQLFHHVLHSAMVSNRGFGQCIYRRYVGYTTYWRISD